VDKLIEIECPVCHANLWVDAEKKNVVQHKRSEKKQLSSFEELLNKEKLKKEAVDKPSRKNKRYAGEKNGF
jgi:uncharacterized protein YbaR (Trm112 family)